MKQELYHYADIGVEPKLQKLVYGGVPMKDQDLVNNYQIDGKKFVLAEILNDGDVGNNDSGDDEAVPSGHEQLILSDSSDSEDDALMLENKSSDGRGAKGAEANTSPLVSEIVEMGYEEREVRRALVASYYHAERAIQYLIEGLPPAAASMECGYFSDSELNNACNACVEFRKNTQCGELRDIVHDKPDLIDDAIQTAAEMHPNLLEGIDEHQQDFLCTLIDSDNDGNATGTGIGVGTGTTSRRGTHHHY